MSFPYASSYRPTSFQFQKRFAMEKQPNQCFPKIFSLPPVLLKYDFIAFFLAITKILKIMLHKAF